MKARYLILYLIVILLSTMCLKAASDTSRTTTLFTINPLPTLPVCQDTSVVSGTVANLTATAPANATFYWYDAQTGGNLLYTGNVFTTPVLTQTTTYYVESEDNTSKCRSARKAVQVSVSGPGSLQVNLMSISETICSGSSVQIGINGAMTNGIPPYKYSWLPATGLSSATDSVVTAFPASSTTYTLTVTDAINTKGSADVAIAVNPNPGKPQISSPDAYFANNNFYICNSSSITLVCSGNYDSYSWLRDGVSTGVTGKQIITDQGGAYSLIVSNQAGCADTSTANVVLSTPQITIRFDDVVENPADWRAVTKSIVLKRVSFSPELQLECKPDSLYLTLMIQKTLFLPKDRPYIDSADRRLISVADAVDMNQEDLLYVDGYILLGDTDSSSMKIQDVCWGKYGKNGIATTTIDSKFELTGLSLAGGKRLLKFDQAFAIIQIKPNPASDETELLIESKEEENVEINIYNTLGQLVQKQRTNLTSGINIKSLKLQNEIPFGIYRISVGNEKGIDSRSVIIGK
ncbi:MAG: T9SS type A sorting domain-containing protein [Bacteroidota bacterium]